MKIIKLTFLILAGIGLTLPVVANEAGFPGRNVNVIGPPPAGSGAIADLGLRQQNEPSCAVNPANPAQICCGFNDYRGIDVPAMGDAWEGISCSRDAGNSWESQLIPGHGADAEYNLGLEFAADPNLVSVPGGLFYNFIAADRNHVGGIYVQRYAWRNKEDGWPLIQVGGPVLISKGTNGRFIDKPHMMGFINDNATTSVVMDWADGTRDLPSGNLGMAAAVFVGNDNNDGTKILYWNSSDWGKTWDNPTKLTESKGVNSGINLAANGDNVCAVWRRFDDTNEVSSILYACSTDRGKRFGKPNVLYETMCPFDQTTLNGVAPSPKDIVSFRSNAFPVIAGDGDKFYVFWSDRGFAAASDYQAGCELRDENNGFNPSFGRIVYAVTGNNGKSWSAPKAVDDAPKGHQFMPAAFGANGEVVVSWIDNRDDVADFLDIDKQMIVDFWKDQDALYRHTADVRAARRVPGGSSSFTPSVKISNYARGLVRNADGSVAALRQMEYNLVNARLFQKGTAPFIGDYVSVTAKAYNRGPTGQWVNSNTAPVTGSPVFHISWGDNRDVRGNAWGDADADGFSAPSPYTPTVESSVNASIGDGEQVNNSTPAVQDPADNQQLYCAAAPEKADRTRDQNIYSAALYPLATLRSPGAVKGAGALQRAMPVYVQNNSSSSQYFKLTIDAQPSDHGNCTGVASFSQFSEEGACPMEPTSTVWVKVFPRSSAVRTVFVTSASQLPVIPVSASACQLDASGNPDANNCQLIASTTLNNDPLEMGQHLEQPDFDSLNSIFASEVHDPELLNPDLLNPDLINILVQNPDLLNPDLLNPDLLNPDLLNPDLMNPDLLNLIVANPDLLNPDLLNILITNPDLLNPDLLNLLIANPNPSDSELETLATDYPELLNPDLLNILVANPDLLNPDLLNLSYANPDLMNPDLLNPDLLNMQLLNPDLLNPDLLNPDLLNPDLLNPDLLNLILLNPDLLNPDLLNPDLMNPDLLNPDLLNPDLLNLLVANPDLLNPDLLNPDLLNPDLLNPDLLNAVVEHSDLENPDIANDDLDQNADEHYIDVTWQVRNDGNTTTGYMAQTFITGPEDHSATQLIVSKPYLRQTTRDCLPVVVSDNQVVVNIYDPPNQPPIVNPDPTEPDVHGLASYWLAPGEVANVTLRIFANDPSALRADRAGLYVNSEACNTGGVCDDQPFALTRRDPDFDAPILTPDSIENFPYIEAGGPDGGLLQFDKPVAYDAGDAQTVPVSCTYEPDTWVPLGSNINTCSAEDTGGNVASLAFEVVVQDTTAPILNFVPPSEEPVTIEATASEGAIVDFATWATASDLVDLDPQVTCPGSGDYLSLGTNIVTCTASDASGNTATASIQVLVQDSTPPVLVAPAIDVSGEASGPAGTVITYEISATDIVDQNVVVACSAESGSNFSLGETTVNCTATDSSGNVAFASFIVRVTDTTAPVLAGPGPIVQEAASPQGNTVHYSVNVFDLVNPDLVAICSPASGSLFGISTTTVQCSATDDAGNTGSASFTVTIQDSTAPVMALPAGITAEATSSGGAIVDYQVTATDSADDAPSVTCAPASGSQFAIGQTLVNCTSTDASGNSASASFQVNVVDTTPPVLVLPEDMTVSAASESGTIVEYSVSATDIADPVVDVSCNPTSGSTFDNGTTTVSCVATDDAGLTASGSFTVSVSTDIIWLEPVEDPAYGTIGPNMNFRWGYGAGGVLFESRSMIETISGKGTAPLIMNYLGAGCDGDDPEVVDLDAGQSSLRYSTGEWLLNWQTGQSTLNGLPLQAGCYQLSIPRAAGQGEADTKTIVLSN